MKINENIPNEILNKILYIERFGQIRAHNQRERYYPYFELQDGRLAISVVAVKQSKKTTIKPQKVLYKCYQTVNRPERYHQCLYIKKVTVHIFKDSNCYYRDIGLYGLGGYIVDYVKEPSKDTLDTHAIINCYAYPKFLSYPSNYYRLFKFADIGILNPEFLKTISKFKYSAFDNTCDAFEYLERYLENPKIELIAKLTNCRLAMKRRIMMLAGKDKNFVIWLKIHADAIKSSLSSMTVIKAYKTRRSIAEVKKEEEIIAYFRAGSKAYVISPVCLMYKSGDDSYRHKMVNYLLRNDINAASYNDYIKAILELGLDVSDTKNSFPKDYGHWHEVRLNQYASLKAMQSPWEREQFNERLKSVADKYKELAYKNDEYSVIVAKSKNSLVLEGKVLNHCVGRMDYDQKIAKEISLIMFIRKNGDLHTPFVTVEFSLVGFGLVAQCFGKDDKKPNEEVQDFVYKEWYPYAVKRLRAIRSAAAKKVFLKDIVA